MNTNFKVIGLTRLGINPKSTAAAEVDALTTWPFELLMPAMPTSLHLSNLLEPKTKSKHIYVMQRFSNWEALLLREAWTVRKGGANVNHNHLKYLFNKPIALSV